MSVKLKAVILCCLLFACGGVEHLGVSQDAELAGVNPDVSLPVQDRPQSAKDAGHDVQPDAEYDAGQNKDAECPDGMIKVYHYCITPCIADGACSAWVIDGASNP